MLDAITAACPYASFHAEKAWLADIETLWMLCPFKVGARVRLRETPVISVEKCHGWLGAKHFLVAGALGTVHEVKFYDGLFVIGVVFDDETWMDPNTRELRRTDHPGIYSFVVQRLEAAE